MLFYADGIDLWRSDGTPRGTVQVMQISDPRDPYYFPEVRANFAGAPAVVLGDKLLFSAYRADHNGRDLRSASATPPDAPAGLSVSDGQAAPAPEGVVAAAAAGGTVTLRWLDRSSNESGFVIERSRRADFATLDRVLYAPADATSYADDVGDAGGTWFYRARAVNAAGGSAFSNRAGNSAGVVGRHVYYNDSAFDGRSAEANGADDGAVATDKQALLPGQAATFANYTSYSRGINGIMVDLLGLQGDLTAADFVFRVGGPGGAWTVAPPPLSVLRRPGAGVGGSDRVTITWPDGAIRNQWLEVTVKANARTGLASPDVFYFGNLVGESGDGAGGAMVTVRDLTAVRRGMSPSSGISNRLDFNRDGRVSPMDLAIVRAAQRRSLATPAAGTTDEWFATQPLL